MKNILQQLSTKTPEGRTAAVPFANVDVKQHLNASSNAYGNIVSRVLPQSQSNVYDIKSGNQIQLGGLDHIDPSLFDDKRLTLAPGQETTADLPTFGA